MSDQGASYRRILKSSSIIGGASVINIVIGLVRTKVLALLLGPSGVGIVSLYTGLLSTAAVVVTMGTNTIGIRQIAEANSKDDQLALFKIRQTMFWGTILMASIGALLVWLLREILAVYVLGNGIYANIVGWLAIGVALSVASASQGALMQGMRRIGDIALLSIYGSLLNTILGLILLWYWGASGLVAFVLISPIINFVLGHWFISRLPKIASSAIQIDVIAYQWFTMVRLGFPFLGVGVISSLVQLWIRVDVGDSLGADSLGHFQAAWTISMQYIGFVLAAMGADYFPRLCGVIDDHKAATRLVNEQTEIALLLSTPVFIVMIGLAPWVIHLLYSSAFMPAVEVLRWQILGDILKVVSWPLGFVILALGAGKTFFYTESLVLLLMGGLIAGGVSSFGLKITGIAFFVSYLVYLPLVYMLAIRRLGFKWNSKVTSLLSSAIFLCVLVSFLSTHYWWGGASAIGLSVLYGLFTLVRLAQMSGVGGFVGQLATTAQRLMMKLGVKG